MSTEVGRAHVTIGAETSGLKRGVQEARGSLKSFASEIPGLGSVLSAVTNPIALAGAGLTAFSVFAKQSITAASDLNETMSKTKVIFGDAADTIIRKSTEMASAAGLSEQAFLDAASTFGVFGKSAGLTGDELAGFSTDLSVLAADMASFSNTTPEEAILALGAALRGETEPIRRYGVLLDDMTLRQKALELGITETTNKALTPQQRVLAAQALIFEQTSDAQGDFTRTSGGLANQQRILKAEVQNLSVAIGEELLPAATDATKGLVQMVGALNDLVAWSKDNRDLFNWMYPLIPLFNFLKNTAKGAGEGLRDLKGGADDAKKSFDNLSYSVGDLQYQQDTSITLSKDWTTAISGLSYATNDLRWAAEGATAANWKWVTSTEAEKEAQEKLQGALSELQGWIGGRLGPEIEDFNDTQSELNEQMLITQGEIDAATAKFGSQSDEVAELKTKYGELRRQYEENAKAHEEATRRILYDLLVQKASVDGLTDDEFTVLTQIAVKWGLVDDATAQAGQQFGTALSKMSSGDATVGETLKTIDTIDEKFINMGSDFVTSMTMAHDSPETEAFKLLLYEMATSVNQIAGVHQVTFNGDVTGEWPAGTEVSPTGSISNASGISDFIVPAGYPNDTFRMMVSSGERVNVETPGQINATENKSSGNVNIDNITINAGAGADGNLIYLQFKRALEADMRNANRAGIPYSNR